MNGFPLEHREIAAARVIGTTCGRTDTFNIIPFAGGHSRCTRSRGRIARRTSTPGMRFISGQSGSGGTELLAALRAALAMPPIAAVRAAFW